MYSNNPYYYKRDTTAESYLRPNDVTNLITEPRQNAILSKVEYRDPRVVVQSIPGWGDITALLSYYRYVFLVVGDFLIKMETSPELEIIKTVRGYSNTKLIAGADGQHIFVINGDNLIKLDFELEPVSPPDGADTSGWEGARLMSGSGVNLYIVIGDDLINVDAITMREGVRDDNRWADATLLRAPGDGYLYIFQNDELIRLDQYNLHFDSKTGEWDGTKLLAGSGSSLYIVRNGELICLEGRTLQRDTNVPIASGWENATLMSYFINYVYLVTEEANSIKNPEQTYRNYADYSQHNCQLSIPRVPLYYYSSYQPYYLYYPYYYFMFSE